MVHVWSLVFVTKLSLPASTTCDQRAVGDPFFSEKFILPHYSWKDDGLGVLGCFLLCPFVPTHSAL